MSKVVVVTGGSALAYRGIPLQSAYCRAKHALRGSVSRFVLAALGQFSKNGK